jgi:hypothetical protein
MKMDREALQVSYTFNMRPSQMAGINPIFQFFPDLYEYDSGNW